MEVVSEQVAKVICLLINVRIFKEAFRLRCYSKVFTSYHKVCTSVVLLKPSTSFLWPRSFRHLRTLVLRVDKKKKKNVVYCIATVPVKI